MQDTPAGYPTDLTVVEPTATVTTDVGDGEQAYTGKRILSWSVTREITTDLPDQVQGVTGESVASATATLVGPDPVTETSQWTPWSGRNLVVRRTGRPVSITAGFGGAEVPVFTGGTIVAATAGATKAELALQCDDPAAGLRMLTSLPPLHRMMYAEHPDIAPVELYPGMSGNWAMDQILRGAGWYATPAPLTNVMVSVPLQGSLWPETGQMVRTTSAAEDPSFMPIAWDGGHMQAWTGPTQFEARWAPDGGVGIDEVHISGWSGAGTGTAEIRAYAGDGPEVLSGPYIELVFTATQVTIRRFFDAGSQPTTVYTRTAGPFDFRLQRLSSTSLRITWTDLAGTQTNDVTVNAAWVGPVAMIFARVASAASLAGLQVAARTGVAGTPAVTHIPTVDVDPTLGIIETTPGVEQQEQWQTLRDIAAAELGACWVDELGRFVFRNRRSLRGVGVTPIPVTAAESIIDLDWTEDATQVRREVRVPVMPVNARYSATATTTVWELDVVTRLPAAGAGPVVIFADLDAIAISLDTTVGSGVSGIGSRFEAHDNAAGTGPNRSILVSVEQIHPRRAKITARTSKATTSPYYLVSSAGDPYLVLRARLTLDQSTTPETYAVTVNDDVDETAGVLELSALPWRQDPADAQNVADWVAGQVAFPQPALQQVQVVADPRRQLGDIIVLSDPVVTGVEIPCLVVGVTNSGTVGTLTQTLAVRALPITFAEFDDVWAAETFAAFNTEWAGQTFTQYNLDALRR